MKKRNVIILLVLLLALVSMFCSCASNGNTGNDGSNDGGGNGLGDESGTSGLSAKTDTTSRKIIYTYSCDIYTDDISSCQSAVIALVGKYGDSYIQSSQSYTEGFDKRASYTVRVKSEDFNAFITELKNTGTVAHESLTSADVTSDYLDLSARKAAKEAEYARLLALYQNATLTEMIAISEQLAAVESTLNSINAKLAQYDSLVELSTVIINIAEEAPPVSDEDDGFFAELWAVIKNSGKAVLEFLKFLLHAVIYILPFAAIGAAIYFPVRASLKKKRQKHTADADLKNKSDN